MQTVIQPIRQSKPGVRKTPALTARLGGISRIDTDYLNTGTFSLVRQYLDKPCPTDIVGGLGKPTLGYAFDIKMLMHNRAIFFYQCLGSLVVKVFSLIRNMVVKSRKRTNSLFPVTSPFLLSGNCPLQSSQFRLGFPVEIGRLDFLPFGSDEERLQSKVNTYRGISRFFNLNVSQITREYNVPMSCFSPERHGLDSTFYWSVKFDFQVANILEPYLIVAREFGTVANSEVNAVKPILALKSRIAARAWTLGSGFITIFDSSEERLKSPVKPFKGSLTGREVALCQIGAFSSLCLNLSRLCLIRDRSFVFLVRFFTLCKGIIIQTPMSFKQRQHFVCLFFVWVRSVFECLLHSQYYTKIIPVKPERNKQGLYSNSSIFDAKGIQFTPCLTKVQTLGLKA
jgi:hypothetical protein